MSENYHQMWCRGLDTMIAASKHPVHQSIDDPIVRADINTSSALAAGYSKTELAGMLGIAIDRLAKVQICADRLDTYPIEPEPCL